jgi:hypothetical protein
VSHSPQRTEKDFLNCGAIVQGHYCQNCGQENIEPKETFWHMVTHFFYDITHFDGSFFVTLKDLLLKPGFLTKEYMKGRRKTYLHPIRMYVFTSAVFFLVFFSVFKVKSPPTSVLTNPAQIEALKKIKEEALRNARTKSDTLKVESAAGVFQIDELPDAPYPDSLDKKADKSGGGVKVTFGQNVNDYRSVTQYDSVQRSLPKEKRDNWFIGMITRRSVSLNEKYHNDEGVIATKLIDKFIHSFPYLLFVSLPLYALFLKLLYIRRKQFFFADHGVFLIHLYIFTFLLMLVYFSLDELNDVLHSGFIDVIMILLLLAGVFYTLKAMRNFYEQSWGKTILKFILFNILCIITAIFLFALFLIFSFYQV